MSLNIIALGKQIKHYRIKKGYSQNVLSEMIDKTPTFLSYIENGIKCMSLDTFIDITNALNVTADKLLKDSLENTIIITTGSFTSILSDCTIYEQKVILEIAAATKNALRENPKYNVKSKTP